MERTDAMIQVGGSRWTRGAMDRIYFNDLTRWYGLETESYNSGNISSARLDGERISNTQARTIVMNINAGKLYFDLTDRRYHGSGLADADFRRILGNIKRAVQTVLDASEQAA